MTRQRRWRGGVAAALLLALAGVGLQNGVLMFAAAIPLVYLAAGSLSRAPAAAVSVTRRLEPQPARPGEAVTATLVVRNDGDRTLPDVRVADGVPEAMAVVAGSPRAGGTLGPGEELTIRYQVVARRGEHAFARPQVRTRGLAAGAVTTREPPVAGEATLVCRLDADAPPLSAYGEGHVGSLPTDRPGRGLAFHSVRDHRPDDPASRIDWRHYAKRGELTTVNYERQVPATVVVVLDAREPNRVVPSAGHPTAVERQAYAATRSVTDLLSRGHDVGVAVLGLDGPGPAGLHWLPPAGGAEQRSRALELFRTATAADPGDGTRPDPPTAAGNGRGLAGSDTDRPTTDGEAEALFDDGDAPLLPEGDRQEPAGDGASVAGGADDEATAAQARQVLDLAPAGAQLALFSPLLDDPPVAAVGTWRDAGRPVTVLSADIVPATTVSGQHEQVRRRTRLARCQATGAATIDWRRGTPLALVVEAAFATAAKVSTARARGEP